MSKYEKSYTPQQEQQVIQLFTRGLRDGEIIVDNTDKTIAKETGIHWQTVNGILNVYLNKKMEKINNRKKNKN
mgnify:FL=1